MRLLVTGALKKDDAFFKHIESLGHSICFMQYENDNLPCEYDWAEGVICNGLFLSHPIEKFTNLRFIQLTSAGFDRVDLYYINSHKIEITMRAAFTAFQLRKFALCG
jgi:lactate dehydrogenase-like 2-hydroxyacid dehydrogenase